MSVNSPLSSYLLLILQFYCCWRNWVTCNKDFVTLWILLNMYPWCHLHLIPIIPINWLLVRFDEIVPFFFARWPTLVVVSILGLSVAINEDFLYLCCHYSLQNDTLTLSAFFIYELKSLDNAPSPPPCRHQTHTLQAYYWQSVCPDMQITQRILKNTVLLFLLPVLMSWFPNILLWSPKYFRMIWKSWI